MGVDGARQVPLHDLHVVDVVLELEVVGSYSLDNLHRLRGAGQEEARDVLRVDRLDQERDPITGTGVRGEPEVVDHHLRQVIAIRALRRDAGQAVQPRAAERLGVLDGLTDPVPKFSCAVRQASDAALPRLPVPSREVVQHQFEPVVLEERLELVGRIRIGKQELHSREAVLGGQSKPTRELDLVEHHREIGSDLTM